MLQTSQREKTTTFIWVMVDLFAIHWKLKIHRTMSPFYYSYMNNKMHVVFSFLFFYTPKLWTDIQEGLNKSMFIASIGSFLEFSLQTQQVIYTMNTSRISFSFASEYRPQVPPDDLKFLYFYIKKRSAYYLNKTRLSCMSVCIYMCEYIYIYIYILTYWLRIHIYIYK